MKSIAEPFKVRERKVPVASANQSSARVESWGDAASVASYLDRCQVDTPQELVRKLWARVKAYRSGVIGRVLDLGAGDGRFAVDGAYSEYVGYEVDSAKCASAVLPSNATLLNACAFSHTAADADVCVGNPPFVRNQDIPAVWRAQVHDIVRRRTGVTLSGLANAWQYFFLHGLASLKPDGLAALVVPFEWVSRPAAEALRTYIRDQGWNVYSCRLRDARFAGVLTTASITVVDKASSDGKWAFYEETESGTERRMQSPSGSNTKVLAYVRSKELPTDLPRAKRGLSPGTQKALVLSESERKRYELAENRDVVKCVTSLKYLPENVSALDESAFERYYVRTNRRCWLIQTNGAPSNELDTYLQGVPGGRKANQNVYATRSMVAVHDAGNAFAVIRARIQKTIAKNRQKHRRGACRRCRVRNLWRGGSTIHRIDQ